MPRKTGFVKDGIEYDTHGRMRYNPEFHENHGKAYTKDDLVYACAMWGYMRIADIALALGRTQASVTTKVYKLQEIGLFEYYRKLGQEDVVNG